MPAKPAPRRPKADTRASPSADPLRAALRRLSERASPPLAAWLRALADTAEAAAGTTSGQPH